MICGKSWVSLEVSLGSTTKDFAAGRDSTSALEGLLLEKKDRKEVKGLSKNEDLEKKEDNRAPAERGEKRAKWDLSAMKSERRRDQRGRW